MWSPIWNWHKGWTFYGWAHASCDDLNTLSKGIRAGYLPVGWTLAAPSNEDCELGETVHGVRMWAQVWDGLRFAGWLWAPCGWLIKLNLGTRHLGSLVEPCGIAG